MTNETDYPVPPAKRESQKDFPGNREARIAVHFLRLAINNLTEAARKHAEACIDGCNLCKDIAGALWGAEMGAGCVESNIVCGHELPQGLETDEHGGVKPCRCTAKRTAKRRQLQEVA